MHASDNNHFRVACMCNVLKKCAAAPASVLFISTYVAYGDFVATLPAQPTQQLKTLLVLKSSFPR